MPKREIIIPIGPSIAYVPLTDGYFSVIEVEDIPKINQWSWSTNNSPHNTTKYARSTHGQKQVALHRLIMDFPEGLVDHKNGNGLHNWKANLRIANHSTNQWNSRCHSDSTCGQKGVCLHRQGWMARISINGKRKHLGFFSSPEEAGEAYRNAAKELHGEFFRH